MCALFTCSERAQGWDNDMVNFSPFRLEHTDKNHLNLTLGSRNATLGKIH
jgi:hypothetical protein